jgi:electron transport complex protein RnfB
LPPRTADAAPDDVAAIDALLPQTQCTRCGFAGCRPYAQAIAAGQAAINRCPPGGTAGIAALARLLARDELPLDPSCGTEDDPGIAIIDADECIGCARCLPVCPVDAIIGAHRLLHTVLQTACTGCELCIQACPVDCIQMQPRRAGEQAPTPLENRDRYRSHGARAEREARDRALLLAERKRAAQAVNARAR